MKIESMRIVAGKLLLEGGGREFYLMDGVYRRGDGETITVRGHQIVTVLTAPDLDGASKEQLENYVADLEQQLSTVGDDAQLANIDLQNALQEVQQAIQTMSSVSKALHDTAVALIRRMG
ncbi:MAG: hypothetical protein PVG71_16000 [Anaerolineae bacterium]|jgi:hypothetical protein